MIKKNIWSSAARRSDNVAAKLSFALEILLGVLGNGKLLILERQRT